MEKKIKEDIRRNMKIWREKYKGVEEIQVDVMGCIVNGKGEQKNEDIGIQIKGKGEKK